MKTQRRVLGIFEVPPLVAALACLVVPALVGSGQQASAREPILVYYDGHMHTTRSDGTGTVAQIKDTAVSRGLDAVIVTDHCKSLTKGEWDSLVAETEDVSGESFLALPGFEVTGSEGTFNRDHFLAYDVDDPFVGDDLGELCPEEVWESPTNPDGTGPMYPESLKKWADYIHSRGGIAVHNHTSGTTQLEYGVNNLEIYNQSHVDDIVSYAVALGIDPQQAWEFAITMNNFAIYGERDLNTIVNFLDQLLPLRLAIYVATTYIDPYIGQVLGWNPPYPPSPFLSGDLNSWDELLMAYVNGEAERPIFGVANSDAHNTGDLDGSKVGTAKNGLYVKGELTARDLYEAIKAGRSFATTGPSIALDVNGELMGDTAYILDGNASVNLSVNAESQSATLVKIDIIKNGNVWQTFSPWQPNFEATLQDDVTEDGYYRVEVTAYAMDGSGYHFAWSNPVFASVP